MRIEKRADTRIVYPFLAAECLGIVPNSSERCYYLKTGKQFSWCC